MHIAYIAMQLLDITDATCSMRKIQKKPRSVVWRYYFWINDFNRLLLCCNLLVHFSFFGIYIPFWCDGSVSLSFIEKYERKFYAISNAKVNHTDSLAMKFYTQTHLTSMQKLLASGCRRKSFFVERHFILFSIYLFLKAWIVWAKVYLAKSLIPFAKFLFFCAVFCSLETYLSSYR